MGQFAVVSAVLQHDDAGFEVLDGHLLVQGISRSGDNGEQPCEGCYRGVCDVDEHAPSAPYIDVTGQLKLAVLMYRPYHDEQGEHSGAFSPVDPDVYELDIPNQFFAVSPSLMRDAERGR